jgi:hypothetical protein
MPNERKRSDNTKLTRAIAKSTECLRWIADAVAWGRITEEQAGVKLRSLALVLASVADIPFKEREETSCARVCSNYSPIGTISAPDGEPVDMNDCYTCGGTPRDHKRKCGGGRCGMS